MVDDDSLTSRQRQTEQSRSDPVNIHNGRHRVLADGRISKKYRAVEDQDRVGKLTTESSDVADHHKPIGRLD